MSTDARCGLYCILRAVSHRYIDEHTNLAVMLFNELGEPLGYRISRQGLERAVKAETLEAPYLETINLDNYCRAAVSVNYIRKQHDSNAHAMSVIQYSDLRGTMLSRTPVQILDGLERLFISGEGFATPRKERAG